MDSRLANELGIISTPTMILLDSKGQVVNRKIRKADRGREGPGQDPRRPRRGAERRGEVTPVKTSQAIDRRGRGSGRPAPRPRCAEVRPLPIRVRSEAAPRDCVIPPGRYPRLARPDSSTDRRIDGTPGLPERRDPPGRRGEGPDLGSRASCSAIPSTRSSGSIPAGCGSNAPTSTGCAEASREMRFPRVDLDRLTRRIDAIDRRERDRRGDGLHPDHARRCAPPPRLPGSARAADGIDRRARVRRHRDRPTAGIGRRRDHAARTCAGSGAT